MITECNETPSCVYDTCIIYAVLYMRNKNNKRCYTCSQCDAGGLCKTTKDIDGNVSKIKD